MNGNVQYTIEGKTYHLRPGDILLTNSLDIHRPEILPGKPYERIVIWLAEDLFKWLKYGEDDLSRVFHDAAFRDYRLLRPGKARISKYYLSRQFKRYTGMGIYQYIMKKRLTISRDLMLAGSSVTQACMDCGFNDYANYLKAFKREFGCNPGVYAGSGWHAE